MASNEKLHTHQKALAIILDPVSYGSFAEIGAGQEVRDGSWLLEAPPAQSPNRSREAFRLAPRSSWT